jgi:hypothetical protein
MAASAWGLSHEVLAGMPVNVVSLFLSGILVSAILGAVLGAAFIFFTAHP